MSNDPTRLGPDGTDDTRLAPGQVTSASGWLGSSGSIDHGRFQPGEIFQQRYRVIGLLGRGGMGEVYRADDLRLGQPVALKFLPPSLKQDSQQLSQFHNEARTARQVSHPNVCRVYDIGEADGHLFLTMEYVDGEDLSSLLRRIGRLPEDKAIEIARQICAGLAAAHERGVVHRDLKPANIMLDGNGKVRIMDFSLAATGPVSGIAGTPAYMAPEQLVGGSVTAKSDIYALGLVLYELFTGKRVFEAKSIADLLVEHSSGSITSPATLVKTLDGAIERAILRCLDPDPARRPASSLAVAAALPGGDPLAAALAAGETPSPEMVAAAGGESATVTLVSGLAWLGVAAVLLFAVSALADRTSILTRVPLTKPPAVLLDRGEELRRSLGYGEAPVDLASGFTYDQSYLNWNRRNGKGESPSHALSEGRPAALVYWIRTSPVPMAPWQALSITDTNDPPLDIAGMTRMTLDTKGRLVAFAAVPSQLESKAPPPKATDWAPLFAAAGLDMAAFTTTSPARTPPAFADERRAWTGTLPETQLPVTIEAASFHGKPVSFEVVGAWSSAPREPDDAADDSNRFATPLLILVLVVSAVVLARQNIRSGRADRRSAYRLGAVLFFTYAAFWALLPHLSNLDQEMSRLFTYLGVGLFVGGVMYLVYLAIEPFVRRSWPTMLVGWSRALSGRLPDPVIGRDLLTGVVAGLLLSAVDLIGVLAPELMGSSQAMPMRPEIAVLEHNRYFLLTIASTLNNGLQNALLTVMMFTVLRELVKRALTWMKRKWLSPDYVAATIALAFLVFLGTVNNENGQTNVGMLALFQLLSSGVFLVVLLRFGLFATVVMFTTNALAMRTPLTLQSAALYAGPAWVMLGVIFAIAAAGFWMATRTEDTYLGHRSQVPGHR
jgi:serine/threonine-protein kinase